MFFQFLFSGSRGRVDLFHCLVYPRLFTGRRAVDGCTVRIGFLDHAVMIGLYPVLPGVDFPDAMAEKSRRSGFADTRGCRGWPQSERASGRKTCPACRRRRMERPSDSPSSAIRGNPWLFKPYSIALARIYAFIPPLGAHRLRWANFNCLSCTACPATLPSRHPFIRAAKCETPSSPCETHFPGPQG